MTNSTLVHKSKRRKPRHGYATGKGRTPTYRSWAMMLNRCRNPNGHDFHYYGARGIEFYSSWLSFQNFLADMGERPDGTSIERIDNSKGYCKENCRWATKTQQARNRRNTVLLTHNNVTKPLAEWCDLLGVDYERARHRVQRGFTSDRVLSAGPVQPIRRNFLYKPRKDLLRDEITGRFLKKVATSS